MDVRCERCNARYAVDDGLVDEAGLAVRCSKCGHLFRVHRPVRGLRVRKRGGEVLPLPDAAQLQRWVVEGRVAREDEISSDGGPWILAGDLKDLAPFFAVVERARRVEAGPAADATGPVSLGGAAAPTRVHDEPTVGDGLAESPSESWEVPAGRVSGAPEPAWTAGPSTTPVEPGRPPRRGAVPHRRGSPWPWILLVLVILGAAAGALYLVRPDWLPLDALGLRPPVAIPQGPATSAVPPAATAPAVPDRPQAPAPGPETAATPVAPPPAAPPSAPAPEAHPSPAAPTPNPPDGGAAPGAEPARAPAAPPPEQGAATPSPGSATAAPSAPASPDASAPLPAAPAAAPPSAPAPPATSAAPKPAAAAKVPASVVPGMPSPAAAPRTGARSTAAADRRVSPVARRSKALLADARRTRDRGNAEAALDLYGQVLRLEPDSADALAGRGLCYLDLSRYEPAEESFKAALQADAQHGGALMGLAETYRYEGRRADAVTYYRRYLAAHPDGDAAAAARKAVQALEESQ